MGKKPVQKTVVRNGIPHLQTYWESDFDEQKKHSTIRGQLKLPVFESAKKPRRTVSDPLLIDSWSKKLSRKPPFPEVVQQFIKAGMLPSAADYLTREISRDLGSIASDDEIIDYLYENDLIGQPAPKGGWKAEGISEQRIDWHKSGVPVETAIEWIEAGIPMPYGVPELISSGVTPERAGEWQRAFQENAMSTHSRARGSSLGIFTRELKSSIPCEDAFAWRDQLRNGGALTERDLTLYEGGMDVKEVSRWDATIYPDVEASQIQALRDRKFSPTSLKSIGATMNKIDGLSGRNMNKVGKGFVDEIIHASDRLGGPKKVVDWTAAFTRADDFGDASIDKALIAERLKDKLKSQTGVSLDASVNETLFNAPESSHEVILFVAACTPMLDAKDQKHVVSSAAEYIGSPEKLKLLRNAGFRFTDNTGAAAWLYIGGMDKDYDPDTGTQKDAERWVRQTAAKVYGQYSHTLHKWVDDENVDPMEFKNALEFNPNAAPLELDATLLNGINRVVADGWI